MKVLLFSSSYLPRLGGLERVTGSLAEGLQKRGHTVSVLTQRHPRSLPATESIDGVVVHRWFLLIPRFRDLQRGRTDLFLAGLFFFPVTLARLSFKIVREKPDVVNLHFVSASALFLLIVRSWIHFRLVASLHGDDVEGLPRGTWFDRWVFRATLRRADAVTACSRYLLDKAEVVEPSITRQAHVVYNGISMEDFETVVPSDTILAVGRMVPKKGFDVLLRAFAECHCVTGTLCLNFIGDGPERSALELLARELGLTEWVTFFGARDRAFVMRAMQFSRLVVVPSREEPFGLVVLEAMAAGKPVIATRVGGLPEVLQDADAILVESDKPDMLSQAIRQVTDRIEREPQFGLRNREIAARFSLERMTDAYIAMYMQN